MRKIVFLVLTMVLLTVVISSCTKTQAQSRPERWEYNITAFHDLEELNELGQQGWELITLIPQYNSMLVFKRKI